MNQFLRLKHSCLKLNIAFKNLVWNNAGKDISIDFGNNKVDVGEFDVNDVIDVVVVDVKAGIGRRVKDWVAARNDELTMDNIFEFLKFK